jgi:hypothetical protein
MSVADQIDDYLRAQLEKIRQGGTVTLFGGQVYTFKTDAGQLVDKNLEYAEHPDDRPMIAFFTGKNQTIIDDTVECGMENHLQDISVFGAIACDKAGTEAALLVNDLSAALKADPWFGGLIDEIQGFEVDVDIQISDTTAEDEEADPAVYAIVSAKFSALYTCLYGSE